MFWAWKDTILSHHSEISGKVLKNDIHRLSDNHSLPTLSFFHVPCNLAEGPPLGNLGPLNEGDLGLLSSDPGFAQRQLNSAYLVRILNALTHYRDGSFSLSNQSVGVWLL
jgi:hypothetical protein